MKKNQLSTRLEDVLREVSKKSLKLLKNPSSLLPQLKVRRLERKQLAKPKLRQLALLVEDPRHLPEKMVERRKITF